MFGVLFVFTLMETFRRVFAVTPVTDSNFKSLISKCIPINYACMSYGEFGEFGLPPHWNVSLVTVMRGAFYNSCIGYLHSADISYVGHSRR